MTYAIIEEINGTFHIRAEGIQTIEEAKAQFHGRCQVLWNAPDVQSAHVMIADTQLDVVEGCKESIHHTAQQPAPTPTPETETEAEDEGKAESGLITEE